MSHGSAYYEVENAMRRERERQAALDRSRTLMTQIEDLVVQLSAHADVDAETRSGQGVRTSRPTGAASASELATWNASAQQEVIRLQDRLHAIRSAEWAADLSAHLSSISASGDKATAWKGQPHQEPGDRHLETTPKAGSQLAAEVSRTLAAVDPEATQAEREKVASAASAIMDGDRAAAPTLLTDLKASVQAIGRAASRRRADRSRAEDLLRELDGIEGPEGNPEVGDLRALLQRVANGETPLVNSDADRVADVRARAIAEEDRRYVAQEVAAAFGDLGYEVHGSFAKELSSGEPAYAFTNAAPNHAAEFRLDDGRFTFRLVRVGQTVDASREEEMESSLCKAVGAMSARLGEDGVSFEVDDHRPAGADPVPFSPAAAQLRTRTKGQVANLRERTR
jgi:hypothetical protein